MAAAAALEAVVVIVVDCAPCVFVGSTRADAVPSASVAAVAAVVAVAVAVVVAAAPAGAVGEMTVGAKLAVCVMLDAAFVAVVVVNCLVIMAAALSAAALAVPRPAAAAVRAAAAAAVVVHFSYVVDRPTSSVKERDSIRKSATLELASLRKEKAFFRFQLQHILKNKLVSVKALARISLRALGVQPSPGQI